jgi:nucleoside-diphosphate-sugar epimerase
MNAVAARVIVFGAGGFLGGVVCQLLERMEVEHLAVTRRPGGGGPAIDLAGATQHELDLLIGQFEPTAIVNASGATHGDIQALNRGNVVTVHALLSSLAWSAPTARLVQVGSAAEYGGAPYGTSQDEQAELRPGAAYGYTKLAGSELVLRAREQGTDAVVLRSFNITGPGSPPSTLLGRVVRQLGTTATVQLGSLEAWRDYIDVRDVATAVVTAATADTHLPAVLNVGSGEASLARDVVWRLVQLSGTDAQVVEDTAHAEHAGSPATTVPWQRADTGLIAKHLGWSATIGLDESLDDTWASRPDSL